VHVIHNAIVWISKIDQLYKKSQQLLSKLHLAVWVKNVCANNNHRQIFAFLDIKNYGVDLICDGPGKHKNIFF
jgi:hypothetical protein